MSLSHLFIPPAFPLILCLYGFLSIFTSAVMDETTRLQSGPYPPKLDKRLRGLGLLNVCGCYKSHNLKHFQCSTLRPKSMKRYKDWVHMGSRDKSRLSEHAVFQQLIINSDSKSYSFFIVMHSSEVQ